MKLKTRFANRLWAAVATGLLAAGCGTQALKVAEQPLTYAAVPEPAAVAATEGLVDVGGARLLYSDTGGPGTPVVLLHPATGSLRSWSYQQAPLQEAGFRVIAYSRRGHAGSEAGTGTERGTAAGDLARLLDHLKVDAVHAIGVAAGGIYAVDFALAFPSRTRSLVIASSIVATGDAPYMQQSNALRPRGFNELPAEFRELGPQYRASNPAGVERWLAIENANAIASSTLPQQRQPTLNKLTLEALGGVRVPVLMLTGDADLYTPPALMAQLSRNIPNARSLVFDGVGHSPHWERPDLFNAATVRFLRGLR